MTTVTVNLSNTRYQIVKSIIKSFNWQISDQPFNWDLCWQDFGVTLQKFSKMKSFQKINHFPGMQMITRKNSLATSLNQMKQAFPNIYDFFPQTWVFPRDKTEFRKNYSPAKIYIIKPQASCQGRGIFLTTKLQQIPNRCVVQSYIENPLLAQNLKFDLRIYALITGSEPLRVFIHKQGLVRLATSQYLQGTLQDKFAHLTNYAINKKSPLFKEASEGHSGHKRNLTWLMNFLQEKTDTDQFLDQIKRIIMKTIVSIQPYLDHNYKMSHPNDLSNSMCFEILGFDILLDSNCKPWLLQVNHSPSFSTDSDLDLLVKRKVISDALKILNLNSVPRKQFNNRTIQMMINRSVKKYGELKQWQNLQKEEFIMRRNFQQSNIRTGYIKIELSDQDILIMQRAASSVYNASNPSKFKQTTLHVKKQALIKQQSVFFLNAPPPNQINRVNSILDFPKFAPIIKYEKRLNQTLPFAHTITNKQRVKIRTQSWQRSRCLIKLQIKPG